MDEKKVGVLYSGGKDSTYAIEVLKNSGFEIACLITMVSENAFSYMLHTSSILTSGLTAKALEIPNILGYTKGEKESELSDIRNTIAQAKREFGFTHLGSGGLCSVYQRSRLEKITEDFGLFSETPLWGRD